MVEVLGELVLNLKVLVNSYQSDNAELILLTTKRCGMSQDYCKSQQKLKTNRGT